ncbi:hypothetical protein PIROE2DRAFT_1408, partial [Piromyces sp. E2]
TSIVQSLINTGILWCINSFSGKGNSSNKKNKAFHERNSYISLYALSRDLIIPPLAGICATQQIKCFIKWRNSNCIIRDLVRDIPTIPLNNGIKALRYSNLQFKNSTSITRIGFQKPYLNLGIIWIIRIRCELHLIALGIVLVVAMENKLSYIGFYCTQSLTQYRTTSLGFVDELFNLFLNKYNNLYLHHQLPELELNNIIYNYIFTFLLGGTLAFNELQIDKAEQRHLNEQLYSSSGSHVPYMEGLAAFLTKTIPIISSSMKLLFDRFRSDVRNSLNDNINDSWESLMVTTLSNL